MRYRTLTKPATATKRLTSRLAKRTTRRSQATSPRQDAAAAGGPDGRAWVDDGAAAPGPRASGRPLAQGGLASMVGPVHRDATRLAAWVAEGAPSDADPRQIHHAGDAAVAAMCQHLATMDRLVYPDVAQVLPHTEGAIARLRADAHEMVLTMRGLQQVAQGDTHGRGKATAELRRGFLAAISDHGLIEEELLREYDDAAPAWRRDRLVAEYERLLPRAPSRPHPYLFARGPFASTLRFGVLGRFDELLDTMDARELPWAPVRAPGRVGPWGAWLLGQPPRTGGLPSKDKAKVDSTSAPAGREREGQRPG
ncbi:hemerythrin domain-containing protein [Frankia sp. AgB1.9]|uniref:hemerythrin domain-containing protein n=1 Tax=unclassified Frankia TaxID=2632575 RepID=UPI0019335C4E|nr:MULTISPECIES: hemerythrin domain-containing protein [unclassified Frankia]MBL7491571.1 hemerythrin domain-containing protein [Frankia sp. AgW1.1]MBL7553501.1 hemerythrin domain-containing protein [Frankia sp. AgB1.9]MBL7617928.1 hemerythrin domain-containing protein [Frankia sp. AgB1.8]